MTTDIQALTDAKLSAAVAVYLVPGMEPAVARMLTADGHSLYAVDPVLATELLEHERADGRRWAVGPFAEHDEHYAAWLEACEPAYHTEAATWPRALAEAVLARKREETT